MDYIKKEDVIKKLEEGAKIVQKKTTPVISIELGEETEQTVKSKIQYSIDAQPIHRMTMKAIENSCVLYEIGRERIDQETVETYFSTYTASELAQAEQQFSEEIREIQPSNGLTPELLAWGNMIQGLKTIQDIRQFVFNFRQHPDGYALFFSNYGRDKSTARSAAATVEMKLYIPHLMFIMLPDADISTVHHNQTFIMANKYCQDFIKILEELGHRRVDSPNGGMFSYTIKVADYQDLIIKMNDIFNAQIGEDEIEENYA